MLLNIAALAVLILFGCHNPFMFNQSTLVLGYLLLYGYDVTGKSYQMRLVGMALGAALTCFVFYRNHKNRTYKRNLKDLIQEFDITSSRTKWQICQILCVPIVLCIAELCNMPRAMWAGIAAMSVILPFMEDMHYRVRKRIVGNIACGVSHTGTSNGLNQSLLDDTFLNVQGQFTCTLLRCTPAHTVSQTGNILNFFCLHPFCLFGNGSTTMMYALCNGTHFFNFF